MAEGDVRGVNHLHNLTSWEVNESVKTKLRDTCFYRFTKIKHSADCPAGLLSYIVNSYDPEHQCFLIAGERVYFNLEDVFEITGLPIDGKAVSGIVKNNNEMSSTYLGVDLTMGRAGGINLKVLREYFQKVKIDNVNSENFERYIRGYVLYILGCVVFPDMSGGSVSGHYLACLDNIDNLDQYAWGAACLAHLHWSLKKFHENKKKRGSLKSLNRVGASPMVLVIFFLERFRFLLPVIKKNATIEYHYPMETPLFATWIESLKKLFSNKHNYITSGDFQKSENPDEIIWMPYKRLARKGLPKAAFCRTLLICFEKVHKHEPENAIKQYGVTKCCGKSVLAYKLPRCPKKQNRTGPKLNGSVDWTKKKEYGKYITAWDDREKGFLSEFSNYLNEANKKEQSQSPNTREHSHHAASGVALENQGVGGNGGGDIADGHEENEEETNNDGYHEFHSQGDEETHNSSSQRGLSPPSNYPTTSEVALSCINHQEAEGHSYAANLTGRKRQREQDTLVANDSTLAQADEESGFEIIVTKAAIKYYKMNIPIEIEKAFDIKHGEILELQHDDRFYKVRSYNYREKFGAILGSLEEFLSKEKFKVGDKCKFLRRSENVIHVQRIP